MKFCPLDLLVQKTNLLDLQVKNPLDLLVKEASRVVAVAELLEGLAEVEDLETPVVPRCQEVRHLIRQRKVVMTLICVYIYIYIYVYVCLDIHE